MDETRPYADLTPDAVLNAIDRLGLRTSGQLLALNSYENRVLQVKLEDETVDIGRFVVAKFYRPGRWTDAQILEEHAFTRELAEREIPVVAPLRLADATLHRIGGHRVALFARRGGRAPDLSRRDVREWLGRFIGRIHAIGATRPYRHRPALDGESFGREPGAWLLLDPETRIAHHHPTTPTHPEPPRVMPQRSGWWARGRQGGNDTSGEMPSSAADFHPRASALRSVMSPDPSPRYARVHGCGNGWFVSLH